MIALNLLIIFNLNLSKLSLGYFIINLDRIIINLWLEIFFLNLGYKHIKNYYIRKILFILNLRKI